MAFLEQWRKDVYRPLVLEQWYRQTRSQRLKYGYSPRLQTRPTNGVVHATHGQRGSTFANEARYLMRSQDVSAHYLVGRSGQVAHLLPEALWTAWTNGTVIGPEWGNERTVNIEVHAAEGEPLTAAQSVALAGLVQMLSARWWIPREAWQLHKVVASPRGRKSDPWFWTPAQFEAWKQEYLP